MPHGWKGGTDYSMKLYVAPQRDKDTEYSSVQLFKDSPREKELPNSLWSFGMLHRGKEKTNQYMELQGAPGKE